MGFGSSGRAILLFLVAEAAAYNLQPQHHKALDSLIIKDKGDLDPSTNNLGSQATPATSDAVPDAMAGGTVLVPQSKVQLELQPQHAESLTEASQGTRHPQQWSPEEHAIPIGGNTGHHKDHAVLALSIGLLVSLIFIAVDCCLGLCVAVWAGQGIPPLQEADLSDPRRFQQWSDTPLSCFSDFGSCLLTCCCPCVTFGRNAEHAGCHPLDTFIKGCGAFFSAMVVMSLVGGMVPCGNIVGMAVIAYMVYSVRMKLRQRYMFHHQDEDAKYKDAALAFFCPGLALMQESRHIDRSLKAGYTLTPFIMPPTGMQENMGAVAVQVQEQP